MAKNQNQGNDNNQRKSRSFMGSELMELFTEMGAFASTQVLLGSIRRGLANVFTNGMADKINPTQNADSNMVSAAVKQVRDNIKGLDLPEDLKQEVNQSITRVLLESVAALGNSKDAERMLRIAKLKDDMAAEISKAMMAQRQRSFQVRIFEVLTPDQRNRLVEIDSWFCDGRRRRWHAVRENIESLALAVAALDTANKVPKSTPITDAQKEETCEAFLKVLESLTTKPTVPKLSPEQWVEKFAKDNPVMGKAIKHAAVHLDLIPDPIPRMRQGQTEADYRAVVTPLITSEKERDERIKSEARRVQIETSRDERARKDKNFADSLGEKRSTLIPSMKEQEECIAYRRRIRDYFTKPDSLETQVRSECLRLTKPYLP